MLFCSAIMALNASAIFNPGAHAGDKGLLPTILLCLWNRKSFHMRNEGPCIVVLNLWTIRGHPWRISDFLSHHLTYLPTYPSLIFPYCNDYFSIAVSNFWKPTYLPKNRISLVDAPLQINTFFTRSHWFTFEFSCTLF